MPEPSVPANDFERWIAGSPVPPDMRSSDELCEGIALAIGAHEFKIAVALLRVLAFADPAKAQTVHDMITAVVDGDERRAVLLAVLGG